MRLMLDGVTATKIPDTPAPALVMGYVTGEFTWTNADWARFPDSVHVRVDATGSLPLASDVLDVEPGNLGVPILPADASPELVESTWAELCARAKTWVESRHVHNLGSTCYIEASRKNQLAQAVDGLPCVFGVAHWGITQAAAEALLTGAEVFIQYLNTEGYDVSVCVPNWFPAPAPKPPTITGFKLVVSYSDGTEKDFT